MAAKKTKVCFKCDKRKKIEQFYKHPQMGDGHLGKCKTCTKADVLEHRGKNLDKVRAYDVSRAKLPHRKALRRKTCDASKAKHPGKDRARGKVARAIKAGLLVRGPCAICGSTKTIHGHHPDYRKPLDVTWLCVICHSAVHHGKV